MEKPIIGITATLTQEGRVWQYTTGDRYIEAIRQAGGYAVVLPPTQDPEEQRQVLNLVDGLLIPGGDDVAPCFYGEEPVAAVTTTDRQLDRFQLALIRMALEQDKPILGICRGLQILNVAFGGTLIQDIPTQVPGAICHNQKTLTKEEPFHHVSLIKDSHLARMLWRDRVDTNTYHHQAIRKVGQGLVPVAHSADGIIEGVEAPSGRVLGVQWHPECMTREDPVQQRLFDGFVALCKEPAGATGAVLNTQI